MDAVETEPKPRENPLDPLPDALVDILEKEAPGEIVAAAPHDLDEQGAYMEGYLLLCEGRLGSYGLRDGRWVGEWLPLAAGEESSIVEGIGMSVLRLTAQGRAVLERRFTLRHGRAVARFHRRLEKALKGETLAEVSDESPEHLEDKLRCDKCGRPIPSWAKACPACASQRKILWRLLDYVKPHKGRAVGAATLSALLTGLSLMQPWLSRPLVNEGFGAAPGFSPNWRKIVLYVSLMALLMVLRSLGQVFQTRLALSLGTCISRDLRNAVYEHLHALSLSFFAKRQTGELVTRVTSDTERLWYFVSMMVIDIVLAFLTLIGIGVCLFVMDWRLAFFTMLPAPIMLGVVVFFHHRLHDYFSRMWHRYAQMTAVVADALPGVRVIKAFGQEEQEVDRFHQQSNNLYDIEMGYIAGARSLYQPTMAFVSGLGSLIVWLLGGWWLCVGKTDLGTLMAFQGFLMMFLHPIVQIAHMDEMLERAATSANRIFEILDTEPAIYSRAGSRRVEELDGRVELRNVSFSYDGVRKVLRNVSLTIEPGQMIGLAGPSGAGKTTLVNLISRFYDVLEGQILIDGTDVKDYDLATLRRKIGVVLQEPFLFHGAIAENIAYGKPDATPDQIIQAARAANAHDFIVGFPDGYDTVVGERGQSLSGGERQRISIARAILNNPTILILDEATSSVDTETEKLIQQAIDRLIRRRTTIAIAHRLSTLRRADRLYILEKGKIIEEGTHEELADKEGGAYAKLLKMQRESREVIGLTGKEKG